MVRLGSRTAGRVRASTLAALAGAAALAASAAEEDRNLGAFKSWHAQRFVEGDRPVCMLWSQPEKDEGDYERRGEIFVFVTHRPKEKEFDKVSFEIGYTFKADAPVEVTIDRETFLLNAEGSIAWTRDAADDAKMVRAMRRGQTMVVKGTSDRGTATQDTYSLLGFTAAHNAIGVACGR